LNWVQCGYSYIPHYSYGPCVCLYSPCYA
jgi:hypothetical protein